MTKHAPVLPITAFVGANGGGKTLAAVEIGLRPAMRRELPILSNMQLDYEGWQPLVSWTQLTEFSGGVVLLDEINSVLPAREYRAMPAQLVRATRQFRKQKLKLLWTDPSWEGADVTLRRVTQGVYVCRGLWADRHQRRPGIHPFPFSGSRVGPVDPDAWLPNRLFRWSLYDSIAMDEFTEGRAKQIGHKYARWFWRPGHTTHTLYDTMQSVGLLDHLDDTGLCVSCNGHKPRKKCSCKTIAPRSELADYEPATEADFFEALNA